MDSGITIEEANALLTSNLLISNYRIIADCKTGTFTINSDYISDLSIQYDLLAQDSVNIGNCIPGTCDVTLITPYLPFDPLDILSLRIINIINEEYELELGLYYPDNIDTSNATECTITAYDVLKIFDKEFDADEDEIDTGEYHTLKEWLAIAINKCLYDNPDVHITNDYIYKDDTAYGVSASFSYTQLTGYLYPTQDFETYRSFVSSIAAACGCNVSADSAGNIRLVPMGFIEADYTFPNNFVPLQEYYTNNITTYNRVLYRNYSKLPTGKKKQYSNKIGSGKLYKFGKNPFIEPIVMWYEKRKTATGETKRCYEWARYNIENQLMSHDYEHFSVELPAIPIFETGDVIAVNDADGNTHTVYISSIILGKDTMTLSFGDVSQGSSTGVSGGGGIGRLAVTGATSQIINTIENEIDNINGEVLKQANNYIYEADLQNEASSGTLLERINADFINADSKLRLGMKNMILAGDKNIKDIYISEYSNGAKITIINSFTVYVGRENARYYVTGESREALSQFIATHDVTLNGEGDPISENCPISWLGPFNGMIDNDNLRTTKIEIHVPMHISFKLKTKTENVTSLPIFYSADTLTSEGQIKYVGITRHSGGWYSTEQLPESYFENNIYQISEKPVKTLKGLYLSSLSWFNELTKDKYEIDENSIEISADFDNAYYEDYVYNQFYTNISGEDDLWFLSVYTNSDRDLINPCDYISYDSVNNKFVINNPVIRGDSEAYNRLYMVFNPGSNNYSVSSYENGSLEYPGPTLSNISALGNILTNDKLIGNDWSYTTPRWVDFEPFNKELAEWNQGDRSNPFMESMNLSNNFLSAIITYEDDTTKEIILPINYADRSPYSPYSLIEKGYLSRASVSSYDKYYTVYSKAKFLQYQRYITDLEDEATPYDLLLGSNNISLNNTYDVLNGNNHAFIGDNNYLLGNAFNSKIIGDSNFIKTDDGITLIGNNNTDYHGLIQENDIVIANELNGFLVRDNKSYLLINGEAIEIIASYKLSRDESDDSYVNLTDYFNNILFRIYAPYELNCDENGISLGNSFIRFPSDAEIINLFDDESTTSLYYPISYNSLKTFYNSLKEHGLGNYIFGSDDSGLFLEDDDEIKQYITWESFSEDDYIDIFNNTDSYNYGGEMGW